MPTWGSPASSIDKFETPPGSAIMWNAYCSNNARNEGQWFLAISLQVPINIACRISSCHGPCWTLKLTSINSHHPNKRPSFNIMFTSAQLPWLGSQNTVIQACWRCKSHVAATPSDPWSIAMDKCEVDEQGFGSCAFCTNPLRPGIIVH